jgi:hypothetical protein
MSDLVREHNYGRYDPLNPGGFYESYFQRANHPTRPLAFWIRYTVFAPDGVPDAAIGELWAVWFDGEKRRTVVAKTEVPAGHFQFKRDRFHARVGSAVLAQGRLAGAAASGGHRIDWQLEYSGRAPPLFLLPAELYATPLPRAKSLVGLPLARYSGRLVVDGEAIDIRDWVGSQNHNWGARHTDRYAWGQVAGFDNAPESFLEVGTGQLRFGPLWTPRLTVLVLRHGGEEYALNSVRGALLRARGRFSYFKWDFRARGRGLNVQGRIEAPRDAFAGLRYYNPPGGEKYCLNSKIASCRLVLNRRGRPEEVLETRHRAAFEILTDDLSHEVEIRT